MIYTHYHFVHKLNDLEKSKSIALILREKFNSHGFLEYNTHDPDRDLKGKLFVLLVAIGGDGTAIAAGKLSIETGCHVLAFNAGNLGFLNPFKVEDVDSILNGLKNQSLSLIKRYALKVSSNPKRYDYALNECLISSIYSDKLIKCKIFISGQVIGVFRSNGVVVSTATGSTAYSLSNGGAICLPDARHMQLTLVAPLSLSFRPLIISSDHEIIIEVDNIQSDHRVKIDGWTNPPYDIVDGVIINGSKVKATYLVPPDWEFFSTLCTKLGWNF